MKTPTPKVRARTTKPAKTTPPIPPAALPKMPPGLARIMAEPERTEKEYESQSWVAATSAYACKVRKGIPCQAEVPDGHGDHDLECGIILSVDTAKGLAEIATQQRGVRMVPIAGLTVPPAGYMVDHAINTAPPRPASASDAKPRPGLIFGGGYSGFGPSVVLQVRGDGSVLAVSASNVVYECYWENVNDEDTPLAGGIFEKIAADLVKTFARFEETAPFASVASPATTAGPPRPTPHESPIDILNVMERLARVIVDISHDEEPSVLINGHVVKEVDSVPLRILYLKLTEAMENMSEMLRDAINRQLFVESHGGPVRELFPPSAIPLATA